MPKTRKMKIITPMTKTEEAVKCGSTEQAYKIFRDILDYEEYELKDQEHLWVMGIDVYGYVVCVYIAAIGAENRMIIDPVDIFATAVNHKAKKIILAHNHPGEEKYVRPSEEDLDLTNKLYHACLPFGITIVDHIIFGLDYYFSFLNAEHMKNIDVSITYKPYDQIKERLDEEKEVEKKIYGDEREYSKAIKIAKKMISKGKSIKEIIEFTELTKEDIDDIKIDIEVENDDKMEMESEDGKT